MRLILLFCLAFVVLDHQAQLIEPEKELLWEISTKSGYKSYIFGTMHTNDRAIFDLADSVYYAFNKANKIVLETDICQLFDEMDTRKSLPESRIDDKGKPYTSMDISSKTLYGDEDGMPQFLDAYFQILGQHHQKEIIALEQIQDQYTLANEFKLSERRVLDNQINAFTQEKLLELYLRGDLDALQRFMKSYLSVQENLYYEVIVKRNQQMLDKLLELLKEQAPFFCAIGAAHLGGEEGLLQLLRMKGYRVRPVEWSVQEPAPAYKIGLKKSTEYIYSDPASGLIAKFPGKPLTIILPDGSTKIIYRELGQGNTYEIMLYPLDTLITSEEIASIYIRSPEGAVMTKKELDNGSILFQGLSDTYPEGLNFVQIQFGTSFYAVIKCYGGNKFMHSNRPLNFFEKVWFD